MVVVLIGGLRRYYDLTGDGRVAAAIEAGADRVLLNWGRKLAEEFVIGCLHIV